jgi:hypothetical protein
LYILYHKKTLFHFGIKLWKKYCEIIISLFFQYCEKLKIHRSQFSWIAHKRHNHVLLTSWVLNLLVHIVSQENFVPLWNKTVKKILWNYYFFCKEPIFMNFVGQSIHEFIHTTKYMFNSHYRNLVSLEILPLNKTPLLASTCLQQDEKPTITTLFLQSKKCNFEVNIEYQQIPRAIEEIYINCTYCITRKLCSTLE